MALNCLVFEKIAFYSFWRQIDKQTNEQMDTTDALSRFRYRERGLNNRLIYQGVVQESIKGCIYS